MVESIFKVVFACAVIAFASASVYTARIEPNYTVTTPTELTNLGQFHPAN